MARYVVSHRRAGKFARHDKQRSRAQLDAAYATHLEPGAQTIGDNAPRDDTARRVIVFDADAEEVAAKSRLLGEHVLVEPEIPHTSVPRLLAAHSAIPFAAIAKPLTDGAAGEGATMALSIGGRRRSAAKSPMGGQALLYLRSLPGAPRAASVTQTIAVSGDVSFAFHPGWIPTALVVAPGGRYWNTLVRGPKAGHSLYLQELPAEGPLGWWHEVLGITDYDAARGEGIRVGVLDTGCGPHGYLDQVKIVGAYLNGCFDPQAGADIEEHGTHVCGILGAQPAGDSARRYAGIAPGAEIFSIRVFPGGAATATQADIVNGIDHLSRTLQVDLINLSLGANQASEIERDAITDALERGTLCLCAAGNGAGAIEYPAAFPEAVAVSALGKEGWAPEGTLSATRYPHDSECYGEDGLFLASFSCFGDGIECCAPGVGIVSTIPNRIEGQADDDAYAAMDGTSMSAPAACGVLAALLSRDTAFRALPRDLTRSLRARQILRRSCCDILLRDSFGGRGVPSLI